MRIHITKENESVWDVARATGTPAERIIGLNGLTHPYALCEGQALILPPPTDVRRAMGGEGAADFARSWGVSIRRLLRANPELARYGEVRPGQLVVRPPSAGAFGSLILGGWIEEDEWERAREILPFLTVAAVPCRTDGGVMAPSPVSVRMTSTEAQICPPLLARIRLSEYLSLSDRRLPPAFGGGLCLVCDGVPIADLLSEAGRIKRGIGAERMLCVMLQEATYLSEQASVESLSGACDCLWVIAKPDRPMIERATMLRHSGGYRDSALCPQLPDTGWEQVVSPDGGREVRRFLLSEAYEPARKRKIPVSRDGETGAAGYVYRTKAGRHAEMRRRSFDDPLSLRQALCEVNRRRFYGLFCRAAALPLWAAVETSLCWEICETFCPVTTP
ncbi:MAG: LysM peptidoglycan-binding domain-containing protein [Clostridia bacterium]|nr:LysM peptidoglycan-binding domain-containing protein [Clostridia bacterium]